MNGATSGPARNLLAISDRALPEVYSYLLSRCGEVPLAEDLTTETFLAAAQSLRRRSSADGSISIAFLIGIARHKLADHWRQVGRDERLTADLGALSAELDDPWDVEVEVIWAQQALRSLAAQHRVALTLRYLDGLTVAEVASVLDRTVEATEALLVRERREMRSVYEKGAARA